MRGSLNGESGEVGAYVVPPVWLSRRISKWQIILRTRRAVLLHKGSENTGRTISLLDLRILLKSRGYNPNLLLIEPITLFQKFSDRLCVSPAIGYSQSTDSRILYTRMNICVMKKKRSDVLRDYRWFG